MKVNIKIYFLLCYTISMVARYHTVLRDNEFDNLINKYEYAVVCFAPSKAIDKQIEKDEKKEIVLGFKDLKKRLKAASDSESFKKYLQQEVGFLLMDTASGKLQEVDDEFGLDVIPTCLLFKQGRVVFSHKQYAQIFDPISKYSILSFLNRYFKEEFEDIIFEKQEEEKLDRQERIAQYNAYALSGYPYGGYYGYGGYPYGYWGGYPYGNSFAYSIGYSSGYGGGPGQYYGGGYLSRGW